MENTTFTNTNSKGQVVIPVNMRKKLGISEQVPLQITLKGNVIHITPVKGIVTVHDTGSQYLELLKKTQGSWEGDWDEKEQALEKYEAEEVLLGKQEW